MTNNKLCDIIGTVGCVIAFLAFIACFFGADAWWTIGLGIALCLLAQFEYED